MLIQKLNSYERTEGSVEITHQQLPNTYYYYFQLRQQVICIHLQLIKKLSLKENQNFVNKGSKHGAFVKTRCVVENKNQK